MPMSPAPASHRSSSPSSSTLWQSPSKSVKTLMAVRQSSLSEEKDKRLQIGAKTTSKSTTTNALTQIRLTKRMRISRPTSNWQASAVEKRISSRRARMLVSTMDKCFSSECSSPFATLTLIELKKMIVCNFNTLF